VSLVGIIANPASGKDVRRLVSQAITVGNQQKENTVRRLLLGLRACGVDRVEIMPDLYGIGASALDGLRGRPDIRAMASLIDMPLEGTAGDSVRAAEALRRAGAGCIVTLGGDGTVRAVAKGCGEVPLLPISTGTNNVVPIFVEGTVAGMAAAYVAQHPDSARERLCYRHKRLDVFINGRMADSALVDVALVAAQFVGARAVWEPDLLRQLFVTRAQPATIGLSSLIGVVRPIGVADPFGAAVTVGHNGRRVLAPITPGSVTPVAIEPIVTLEPGVVHAVSGEHPAVLALDGEREIELRAGDRVEVALTLDGPWIVNVERTMLAAVEAGMFER
jgi:predicted polyphosphate/ATP-dependent NAD kinase